MATKYRKVETRIWIDEKFSAFDHTEKLVFLFLLTNPSMTSIGAMRGSIVGLADELDMPVEAFRKAIAKASGKGMVRLNERAKFVWLPNFLKYNPPESPNVVKAWQSAYDSIPECAEKVELLRNLKGYTEGLTEGFRKAFREVFAYPEPEPEPEPDIKNPPTPQAPSRPPGGGGVSPDPIPDPIPDAPPYVFPPVVFTNGKQRDPVADEAWAQRLGEVWRRSKGGRLPAREIIGTLCEHVDSLGIEEVERRFTIYCESVHGRFAKLRNFASAIDDWKRLPTSTSEPSKLTLEQALEDSRRQAQERRAKQAAARAASGEA